MDFRQINKNLQKEFAIKKIKAEEIASRNNSWLVSVPAYFKLVQIEKQLALEISKQKIAGKSIKELQTMISDTRKKKKQIMSKLGLKPEDLVPQYSCKICGDTGVVGGAYCKCFKKRKNEELIKAFGEDISKDITFKNYDLKICKNDKQKEALSKLKDKLEKWVSEYPNVKKRDLMISGKTGLGKTYLTKCVVNSLLERGFSVCFVSAFELNNCFLKYHTSFDADKYSWLEPFIESDFLIIDDLGTETKLKNVTNNYLHLVLSERERFSRPVIITTNYDADYLLNKYNERIYSRLINKRTGAQFLIDGDDLRVTK